MRVHTKVVALATMIIILALAACQGAATPEAPPAATQETPIEQPAETPQEQIEPTEPAAQTGGSLVVYSGRSESLVGPMIEAFAAETGIDVQVRYGNTAEIAATLLEEGANSPADLFYAQDPGGLGAVQQEGMLAELPAQLLAQVPERFQSPANDWVGISGRARVIAYNTQAIDDPASQLPQDIFGFTEPEWSGRLGWAPTNGSFQAMVTGMRAIWGEERAREWLEGIQANEPIVYENNTAIVAAVGTGEVDAGFVNHYYLYRFIAEEGESFGARNYFLPGGGPGSLIMVSGAGILNTASNPDNALRLLEYMLSVDGQQYFASETYEYSLVDGVEVSPLLPPLAELDAQAVDIDLAQMADLQGTVALLSDVGILP